MGVEGVASDGVAENGDDDRHQDGDTKDFDQPVYGAIDGAQAGVEILELVTARGLADLLGQMVIAIGSWRGAVARVFAAGHAYSLNRSNPGTAVRAAPGDMRTKPIGPPSSPWR